NRPRPRARWLERPCPEGRRHARHAGNRPRDPARRILRRPRLRGAAGRGQRQRPAAACHRLIGFLTDRHPDAGRLGSPPRRPLPHARFVLRHDRRHPVPMLYEERSSESRCGTPMSEIDRDLLPSREEEHLLKRALGSAIPEFIARFGAAGAVKRVEAELRRARRARSRKLYAFWSAVLAHIDSGRSDISIRGERTAPSPFGPRRGCQSHEGPARLSDDPLSPATAAGAAPPSIAGQVLETPAPNAPRRAASRA